MKEPGPAALMEEEILGLVDQPPAALLDAKIYAYRGFVELMAEMMKTKNKGSQNNLNKLFKLKSVVCLLGSKEVIKNFLPLLKTDNTDEQTFANYFALITAMRKDIGLESLEIKDFLKMIVAESK